MEELPDNPLPFEVDSDWLAEESEARAWRIDAAERSCVEKALRKSKLAEGVLRESYATEDAGRAFAVVMWVRNSGCKNRTTLAKQLEDVLKDARWIWSSSVTPLARDLDEADRAKVVSDWSGSWYGSTKLGYTHRFLLSFPSQGTWEQRSNIVDAWCDYLFVSGYFGEHWDYYLAVRDYPDHLKANVVVNRRGSSTGHFLKISQHGTFSPMFLREILAKCAAENGIDLDASSRVSRGIYEYAPRSKDIYAAKREISEGESR